jgi:hypothetical protein
MDAVGAPMLTSIGAAEALRRELLACGERTGEDTRVIERDTV